MLLPYAVLETYIHTRARYSHMHLPAKQEMKKKGNIFRSAFKAIKKQRKDFYVEGKTSFLFFLPFALSLCFYVSKRKKHKFSLQPLLLHFFFLSSFFSFFPFALHNMPKWLCVLCFDFRLMMIWFRSFFLFSSIVW